MAQLIPDSSLHNAGSHALRSIDAATEVLQLVDPQQLCGPVERDIIDGAILALRTVQNRIDNLLKQQAAE